MKINSLILGQARPLWFLKKNGISLLEKVVAIQPTNVYWALAKHCARPCGHRRGEWDEYGLCPWNFNEKGSQQTNQKKIIMDYDNYEGSEQRWDAE